MPPTYENHAARFLPALTALLLLVGLAATAAVHPPGVLEARSAGCAGKDCELLKRPSDWKDEDAVYKEYFSATDERVKTTYNDRWHYQEMQLPYASTSYHHEHLDIGSTNYYGHAPYEGDVRHDFAQQVVRLRVDSAIRTYFAPKERGGAIKSAQQTLTKLGNLPLKVSDAKGGGEFRIGYDVFSNSSKLEYVQSGMQAGLYQSTFLGTAGRFDAMTFRMTANPGLGLPSARLNYAMDGSVVEGGLSKPLSSSVTTDLISRHPVHSPVIPHSYQLVVSYRF